jgi:hypothetical protein
MAILQGGLLILLRKMECSLKPLSSAGGQWLAIYIKETFYSVFHNPVPKYRYTHISLNICIFNKQVAFLVHEFRKMRTTSHN